MSDPNAFTKLVPGFDFLQTLVKNAGSALPGIGQWVAPTLNPEELEKRINELRTVQFWLEQNARMLGATIQALEVQRMTLSTLKTMNVQMGDLRDALTLRVPEPASKAAPQAAPLWAGWPMPAAGKPDAAPAAQPAWAAAPAAAPLPGAVDPMQWWTALTQQFTQLASHAMKEGAGAPAAAAADAAQDAAVSAQPAPSYGGQPTDDAAAASDGAGDLPDGRRAALRKKPPTR